MLRFIKIICLLFVSFLLSAQQSNVPFSGIVSAGEIPSEFLLSTSSKIESYKNINPGEFKDNKEILIKSFNVLDDVLQSGRVSFGDPFSTYFNKIVDEILKDQPELRTQAKIYNLKSASLNAATAPYGFIFVNTGSLAYLENEAQLAFVICHELAHMKVNHWKDSYVDKQNVIKGKGIYGSMSLDERIELYFNRSHDYELEADSLGIELYLQTRYDPSEIIKFFNIEKFEGLPFANKPFDIGFFNSDSFAIPGVFFKDSIAVIKANETTKDEYHEHPNIEKRTEIAEKIINNRPENGNDYLVSESEFHKLSEISKFECVRLELLGRNYTRAFYDAYLLMDKYPDNEYLLVSIAKALYGLAKFRNINEFHLVTSPYSKIEGESQQLYYLFRQLNAQQLNTVALKYVHDLKRSFPENIYLEQMETDLINDLVFFHKILLKDFNDIYHKYPGINEHSSNDANEMLALKKKFENFHLNAFCGEKHDTSLISKFHKAEFFASQKRHSEELSFKEKEKQEELYVQSLRENGLPIKYQNVIVVDPIYVDLDFSGANTSDNTEKYKVLLDEVVNEFNRMNKSSVRLLSSRLLPDNIQGYNQLCTMKELREELLTNHKCTVLPLSLSDYNLINESGTLLLCFPVILGKGGLHYYNMTYYDVYNGETVYENSDRSFSTSSLKDLLTKDLQILTKK
ncbi:MAG TPA: M48 family metallopeptidase [Bacteroidales bacterium]|nr:M48 family metallopeptidase [Bacteroidales bacterium]